MQLSPIKLISLFCWGLLSVTAIVSIFVPKAKSIEEPIITYYAKTFFMTMGIYINIFNSYIIVPDYPIAMNYYIYFISFIILIILIVLSCCLMFFSIFKKEDYTSGMFGEISRFHTIPLLCVAAIFIIGETLDYEGFDSSSDAPYICNFIFSIIGICTLIMVHYKTNISSKVAHYIIKQMTYGWLFVMLVYNLFFCIYVYGKKKIKDNLKELDYPDFSKNCSLAFCIVMGIFNLLIAFLLKNAIICIANCFIYLGMTIWFFNLPEILRKNGDAEGAIDIVMMVLSLSVPSFLIYKYKSQVLI